MIGSKGPRVAGKFSERSNIGTVVVLIHISLCVRAAKVLGYRTTSSAVSREDRPNDLITSFKALSKACE